MKPHHYFDYFFITLIIFKLIIKKFPRKGKNGNEIENDPIFNPRSQYMIKYQKQRPDLISDLITSRFNNIQEHNYFFIRKQSSHIWKLK